MSLYFRSDQDPGFEPDPDPVSESSVSDPDFFAERVGPDPFHTRLATLQREKCLKQS